MLATTVLLCSSLLSSFGAVSSFTDSLHFLCDHRHRHTRRHTRRQIDLVVTKALHRNKRHTSTSSHLIVCHSSLFSSENNDISIDDQKTQSTERKSQRLMVFGLGNVGTLVAKEGSFFRTENNNNIFFEQVYGTARSGKSIEGVEVVQFNSQHKLKCILPSCTHILVTIPPVDTNTTASVGGRPRKWSYFCDPVLDHPNFSLRDLVSPGTWIGYVSSTSVYGNHDGEWVTEDSEVKCQQGSKGELYYRAEEEWRHASRECGWRLHVFRCAGLYGNGRSALHTLIMRKQVEGNDETASTEKNSKKKLYPTSRIHEEDVCRAVLYAMHHSKPSFGDCCTWNLADNNPAPRNEVMQYGIQLLDEADIISPSAVDNRTKIKPPQSERAKRRQTDRKRVDNKRMKELLLPSGELMYPTYKEGLRSVLEHNRKQWS